ncbi:MAG: GH3 auxin-responsive promoter family protein [Planctomycetes bacterium]|nr:GH3 auxin-responsive promoter family protein [Planctomycetota bacterium]
MSSELVASTANLPGQHHMPLADRFRLAFAKSHARRMLSRMFRATDNLREKQTATLLKKIRRNASSEYGRDHGFADIKSDADFRRRVPITSYEDLEPYIEKVKAGDLRAMFGPGQTVHMFAKTSGTCDRPKYIPVTDHFLAEYRRGWNAFGVKVLMDHPGSFLRPIVQVASRMDEEHTVAGFPCGAISGLMAATQKRLVRRYYVVPRDIAYIDDAAARYYCVLRFSIATNAAFLVTASPATQLKLARIGDKHAERLIRDVRDGTIAREFEIPSDVRLRLERRISPDTDSAQRLNNIANETGRLLPRDYWNLGFLANWTGGTMGLYLRDFQEFFGNTPVRDIGLLASEGRMSIPIEDGSASGILDVADNYFEFIAADEYGIDNPTVLGACDVEVDKEYYILLTTSAGFYRYDIGDRVRVTGFYGDAPLIEFLHKGQHTSSLAGEKLNEKQVVTAFEKIADRFGYDGCNFVVAPKWDTTPYYLLHLESGSGIDEAKAQALAKAFDHRLCSINIEYDSKRASSRLGPVQVNLLPANWLTEFDRVLSQRNRPANEQFKHRFLLSEPDADRDYPRDSAQRAPIHYPDRRCTT